MDRNVDETWKENGTYYDENRIIEARRLTNTSTIRDFISLSKHNIRIIIYNMNNFDAGTY